MCRARQKVFGAHGADGPRARALRAKLLDVATTRSMGETKAAVSATTAAEPVREVLLPQFLALARQHDTLLPPVVAAQARRRRRCRRRRGGGRRRRRGRRKHRRRRRRRFYRRARDASRTREDKQSTPGVDGFVVPARRVCDAVLCVVSFCGWLSSAVSPPAVAALQTALRARVLGPRFWRPLTEVRRGRAGGRAQALSPVASPPFQRSARERERERAGDAQRVLKHALPL